MAYRIRMASPGDDAEGLLAVYAPYVLDTDVSFETAAPTVDEYRLRVASIARSYPYLVVERTDADGARIAGFAYAHGLSDRDAYAWSVETSIYLAADAQGCGLGSVLLDTLEALLRRGGYTCAYACITADNAASVAFHEKHGYRPCGRFDNCAFKRGRWLSVVWMSKDLAERGETPAAPRMPSNAEAAAVLERANARLRARTA